ncbi:MAG: Wzz/FepE/Etk N-terminal domain-containing protein [Patescibacteria group bacterium]
MKNYLQIIISHKKLILFVAALCAIFSFIFVKVYPTTYTASTLLSIHRVNKEVTEDFQYDNYYAIQAAEFVGNTVVSLLQSPEAILEIYKKAKLDRDIDIFHEVKKFRPKQLSSHLVKVKITNQSQEKAEKLAKATVAVINDKVKKLEVDPQKQNSFEIGAQGSVISTNKYNPYLVTALGLICGLFLGVGLAFLGEYFKPDQKI